MNQPRRFQVESFFFVPPKTKDPPYKMSYTATLSDDSTVTAHKLADLFPLICARLTEMGVPKEEHPRRVQDVYYINAHSGRRSSRLCSVMRHFKSITHEYRRYEYVNERNRPLNEREPELKINTIVLPTPKPPKPPRKAQPSQPSKSICPLQSGQEACPVV